MVNKSILHESFVITVKKYPNLSVLTIDGVKSKTLIHFGFTPVTRSFNMQDYYITICDSQQIYNFLLEISL